MDPNSHPEGHLDIVRTDLMLYALRAFVEEPFYHNRDSRTTFNDSQIRALRQFLLDRNNAPAKHGEVKAFARRIDMPYETARTYLSLLRCSKQPKHWRHIKQTPEE